MNDIMDDSCTGVMPSLFLTKTALRASLPPPVDNYTRRGFDVAVALVCMLSLLLCGRSILRGIMLQQVGEGHVAGGELWILALWLVRAESFTAQNWSRKLAHSLKLKPCYTIGGCANSKYVHVCFSLHVHCFSMSPPSLPVSVWLLGVCAVLQGHSGPCSELGRPARVHQRVVHPPNHQWHLHHHWQYHQNWHWVKGVSAVIQRRKYVLLFFYFLPGVG